MSEERTVYITNLDDKVTKDILEEIFTQVGPVESVAIINGTTRYSFVQFADEESVPFCISTMDGLKLYGTAICVRPRANTEQERKHKLKYGNQRRHSYGVPRGSSSTDDVPEYNPMKPRRSYNDNYSAPPRYNNNQGPVSRPLVSILSLPPPPRDPFVTPTFRNPMKERILGGYYLQPPRRPGNQPARNISAGQSYSNISVAQTHRSIPIAELLNNIPGVSSRRSNSAGHRFADPYRTF